MAEKPKEDAARDADTVVVFKSSSGDRHDPADDVCGAGAARMREALPETDAVAVFRIRDGEVVAAYVPAQALGAAQALENILEFLWSTCPDSLREKGLNVHLNAEYAKWLLIGAEGLPDTPDYTVLTVARGHNTSVEQAKWLAQAVAAHKRNDTDAPDN